MNQHEMDAATLWCLYKGVTDPEDVRWERYRFVTMKRLVQQIDEEETAKLAKKDMLGNTFKSISQQLDEVWDEVEKARKESKS